MKKLIKMNKFNPFFIVIEHFKTFNRGYCIKRAKYEVEKFDNQNNENFHEKNIKIDYYWLDFIIFLPIPILISIILVFGFNIIFDITIYNSLLTIFSISIPLLLTLLVFMYDMVINIKENQLLSPENKMLKLCLIKEVSSNISFSILCSIVTLILIGAAILIDFGNIFSSVGSCTIFIFLFWSILTVFMVVKRTYLLIFSEIGIY